MVPGQLLMKAIGLAENDKETPSLVTLETLKAPSTSRELQSVLNDQNQSSNEQGIDMRTGGYGLHGTE